ncbi:STAS domain-containing protein [Actinoplanes missouriensis]|uniref:STAS domain-containing protein n=1 Tax=Actinoplanes missouriensis TaxID=1866 RepID=UPI00340BC7C2
MERPLAITPTTDPAGIRLRGTLGASTLPLLETSLERLLDQPGDVVLDLAGVTFVDSAGLRALVRTAASLEARSRRLLLENPRPQLFRLAEAVGYGIPAATMQSPGR